MTYVGKLDANKVYGADSGGKVGNVTPGGGGGGWQTTYELDFTTLASGSLINGSNTIDGVTWTVENRSVAADMGINASPGEGLMILGDSTADSSIFDGTRTGALVTVKLTDLDPSLAWPDVRGLRVFSHVGVSGTGSGGSFNVQALLVLLENYLATGVAANTGAVYGQRGTGPTLEAKARVTTTSLTGEASSVLYGSNDVICIEFYKPWTAAILLGTYSGGWPEVKDMTLLGWADTGVSAIPVSGTPVIQDKGAGLQSPAALAFTFAMLNLFIRGAPRCVLKRLKIDRM